MSGGNILVSSITEDSLLLSPPRASAAQARAYIVARGSVYDPQDVSVIVNRYWEHALPTGIDPMLAIAQCIHETSEGGKPLSSWWAQRPRRNSAGLGVTGETRPTAPSNPQGWVHDTDVNPSVWRKGLAFASWNDSVRAQLGRLLAYAIPDGQGTDAQKALIAFALNVRPLGVALRGSASTPKQLGAKHNPTGQGWAKPGIQYGAKIAAIARAIQGMQV